MAPSENEQPLEGVSRRLWTPWRMPYVGGGSREEGCIFCSRISSDDDVRSLILHRGPRSFVIMNLFPYNTGHVMIVPNEHAASPEDASPAALMEMATLLPAVLRAARRAFSCHGFNVGLNVGAVAGAGVVEHMHQHVVPRWTGDANFMPILGATMVIPELIPVTYGKLRAELARELAGTALSPAAVTILDRKLRRVIVTVDSMTLPRVELASGRSVAQMAIETARAAGLEPQLAGWAGETRADGHSCIALTLVAEGQPGSDLRWVELGHLARSTAEDRLIVERALRHLPSAGGS